MNRRLSHLALACALATLALYGLGWALTTADTAQAAPVTTSAATHPDPAPDPRWLKLVQAAHSASDAQAPAATEPTIDYLITDQFIFGRVPLPSTVIVEVIRGGSRVAIYHLAPIPDQSGFLYAASLEGSIYDLFGPRTDDVIWLTQGTASISLTVPALDGLATAATDIVSGTAPAGGALLLYLYPFADPAAVYTRAVSANGSGEYESLWSPEADVRPRDSGYVRYTLGDNSQAYARFVTPFLRAQVGGFAAEGFAAPNSEVSVTSFNSTGVELGQRLSTADANGRFTACPDSCATFGDNLPAYKPGDTLVASAAGQTISLTLPTLSAQADLGVGWVHGQTTPNQLVTVARFSGPAPRFIGQDSLPSSLKTVTATAGGAYSLVLPLQPQDYGQVTASSPDGHEAYARFAVPYLSAQLGQAALYGYLIEGQVDDQAQPLTITVEGASGYLKSLWSTRVGTTGYFYDSLSFDSSPDSPRIVLETGDTLTLTTARGVQLAYTIPLLTAEADVVSQMISGRAPPGAAITIFVIDQEADPTENVPPTYVNYTFVVTATAQGNYSLDFAPLGHFGIWAIGNVTYRSPEGHAIFRNFRTLQNCLPLIESIEVGGNLIIGQTHFLGNFDECSPDMIVTLRDGQGQLKYAQTLYPDSPLYLGLWTDNQPVIIRPGDHVLFSSSDQALEYVVPPLTVVLNRQAGTITGQAPPGSALTFNIVNPVALQGPGPFETRLTTTATVQGTYQLHYPLRTGDRVVVGLSGPPRYVATGVLPALDIALHHPFVFGLAAPLAPYTFTIQSARPGSPAPIHGTVDNSGYLFLWLPNPIWAFEPGDTASLAMPGTVRSLTLPALTAHIDQATGAIQGTAPPGARLTVLVNGLLREVTATAQGEYQVAFGDLTYPAGGTVQFRDNSGDSARLAFSSPRWNVTLHNACTTGTAPVTHASTAVTLTAPGGEVKGTLQVSPYLYSSEFSACFPSPVESGDQLSMSGPGGPFTYVVPALTASHDPVNRWVTGIAPANSRALFSLIDKRRGLGTPVLRRLLTGNNGSYGLDISDLQLMLGEFNSVTVQDQAGNTVRRDFITKGWRAFLPVFAQ
jgi:hypothetical protein